MTLNVKTKTAARLIVDCLVANNVDHIFCVPGESYLSILDALRDEAIKLTVSRNEAGASMMADAYGKATGRPGICFVTRGPGAANAFAGIHVAKHDSTPMILFVGQVERNFRHRGAFQEVDYEKMFSGEAKWVCEINEADRTVELVTRAFTIACSGRPGPVVLSLPKDMLDETADSTSPARAIISETSPSPAAMRELSELINRAKRPIFVIGGSRWDSESKTVFERFARETKLSVVTSYRRAHLFDAMHPSYAGDLGLSANPNLIERVRNADLLVALGARLGQIPTQSYRLLNAPNPQMRFVHIYPDAEEFGRVYTPNLAIHATPSAFVESLSCLDISPNPLWATVTEEAHQDYLRFSSTMIPSRDVDLARVVMSLRQHLPANAVICNGAGNYASWIHRYFRFTGFASHIAPTSASMGYGVPAAVAMKRLHPDRLVISINGDGDFLMNGQEFATAVQYQLPIIVIVCDNASYGTIRMYQEMKFPGRVCGTDLKNPDFAAYARAFGGFGATVDKTDQFIPVLDEAIKSGQPSIIHIKMDPDRITPQATLTNIRREASLLLQNL